MKKLILFAVCLFSLSFAFSQNHMKFMGIEVNGKESTVEQRLLTKGFTATKDDLYKGRFSGYDVKLRLKKTVKSKTVYCITVLFDETVSNADLSELENSLKEKYSSYKSYEKLTDEFQVSQFCIEMPEGKILLDFAEKSLSYMDNANIQKNRTESKDDL